MVTTREYPTIDDFFVSLCTNVEAGCCREGGFSFLSHFAIFEIGGSFSSNVLTPSL